MPPGAKLLPTFTDIITPKRNYTLSSIFAGLMSVAVAYIVPFDVPAAIEI